MAYEQIQSTQTDAKSPIDEQLMDVGLRLNSDDHEARINVLESASGGGSASGESGRYATMLTNRSRCFNDLQHWRKRYDIHTSLVGTGGHDVLSDYEGKNSNNRFFWRKDKTSTGWYGNLLTAAFGGHNIALSKDNEICFRVKEGENYFGVGYSSGTTRCDNIEIYVDDQSVTTAGLVDETGTARSNGFTAVTAITKYNNTEWFYGLDGKPHVITIKNNDSGSNSMQLESVAVGYLSPDYALGHTVKIDKCRASVKGTEVSLSEQSKTFSASTGHGHTGMLKVDQAGTVTAVDGLEPAMTQVRPEEEIEFSSVVTSLPVKSVRDFPDNGICLFSSPTGDHHFFSYGLKVDSAIANHQFLQVLWQTKPAGNITPLLDLTDSTLSSLWGDININFWAEAPIHIDATNNKLDFTVTKNGTTTTHVATLSQGYYAADLVKLGTHIEKIMQSVKPLSNGSYFVEWSKDKKTWHVGIRGNYELENLGLLLSTGANVSTSVGPTLGFNVEDYTGSLSYEAETERYHEAVKVQYSSKWISQGSPQKKGVTPSAHGAEYSAQDILDASSKAGEWTDAYDTNSYPFSIFYPDPDATGLEIFVGGRVVTSTLEVSIDGGAPMYLLHQDSNNVDSDSDYIGGARIFSCFVSFPRGSKAIRVKTISSEAWNTFSNSGAILFLLGAKQYNTKPRWEELTDSEAILECFDIAPLSQYGVRYGHTTSLYAPQSSQDNVNSITESGSWASSASRTDSWNGAGNHRYTSTSGDYVDYNITLQGKGTFRWMAHSNTTSLYNLEVYVSSGTINESTDIMAKAFLDRLATTEYDWDAVEVPLPAGTWTIRIKNGGGGSANLYNLGFTIIDTVPPQTSIVNVVEDNVNVGMGIPYPIHTRKHGLFWDGRYNTPYLWRRGIYMEGEDSFTDSGATSQAYEDADGRVGNNMLLNLNKFMNSYKTLTNTNEYIKFTGPCKSIVLGGANYSTYSAIVNSYVDGVSITPTSQRTAVKGGGAPTATRYSYNPTVSKIYEISGTMVGTVFSLLDTKGFRVGQKILLVDSTGAEEEAIVASIITDASITVNTALTTLLPANIVSCKFYGLHSITSVLGDNDLLRACHFGYEPLPLLRSRCRQFTTEANQVLETKTVYYKSVSGNSYITYPVHSDGVMGDFNTSTISIIRNGGVDTSWYVTPSLYVAATGTIDVQIQSTRMVAKNLTDWELYYEAK